MEARAVRGVFLAIASLWASSVPASGADRSLTGPGSVVEGKERGEPKVFHVVAKVEIGPTGDITRVIPDLALGREVGGAVERAVRALSFTPATVDDKPAAGTTFVRMMGCAVPLEQDGFRLAFAYTSHGPGYSKFPHPTYPAAALRSGATASAPAVARKAKPRSPREAEFDQVIASLAFKEERPTPTLDVAPSPSTHDLDPEGEPPR